MKNENKKADNPAKTPISLSQKSILAQQAKGFVPLLFVKGKISRRVVVKKFKATFDEALKKHAFLNPISENGFEGGLDFSEFILECWNNGNNRIYNGDNLKVALQITDNLSVLTVAANALYADKVMLVQLLENAYQIYLGNTLKNPETISFTDYIQWQQTIIKENMAAHKFWKNFKGHSKSNLTLYLSSNSVLEKLSFGEESSYYPQTYTNKIEEFCKLHECSFETPLLLSFFFLLKYFSSNDVILLGLYSDERYYGEFKDIDAPLARILPFIFYPNGEERLSKLIKGLEFRKNEITGWGEYCPANVFTPDFVFECNEHNDSDIQWTRGVSILSSFKLLLNCDKQTNGLQISFVYSSNSFAKEAIKVLKRQFKVLLDNILSAVKDKLKPGSLYKSMSEEEFEKSYNIKLSQESPTVTKTVVEQFEEQAKMAPESAAITWSDQHICYKELNTKANQLAHTLKQRYSVGKGSVVAIALERSINQVIAILGTLKTGAAYLPIDPNQPIVRQQTIMQDAGVKTLILGSDNFIDGAYGFFQDSVFVIDIQLEATEAFYHNADTEVLLDDTAYIIYTSGSTGTPKGVEIGHYSLSNYITWFKEQYTINNTDKTIIFSSLCYDLSYSALWPALTSGCHIILEDEKASYKPDQIMRRIVKERVTFVKLTPSHFSMLVNVPNFKNSIHNNQLRLILLGGEKINASDVERWFEFNPKTTIVNHYGPTETTIGVCVKHLSKKNVHEIKKQSVIGKPIAGNKIFLLDEEGLMVPPGIRGELAVAGPGLAKGYYRNPELTKNSFRPLSVNSKSPVYFTGDIGVRTADGEIIFLGRRDSQIKIRGFRIETGEIETHLESYDGVEKSNVIMWEGTLAAILKTEKNVQLASLKSHLNLFLPNYMIPHRFLLLPLFPVNANGKINLEKIHDELRKQESFENDYEPPQNEKQQCLVEIFEEILGKKPLGIRDDFFRNGGHSLKAIQVATLAYHRLNIKLEVRTIFDFPNVEELSNVLFDAKVSEYEEIPLAAERDYYPLSHGQKRLWILNQYEQKNISYNRPASYILEGPLSKNSFDKAFKTVVERHESLRTKYGIIGGEPVQSIMAADQVKFKLNYKNVSRRINPKEHATKLCSQLSTEPFDLSTGRLIKALLLKIGPDQHVICFVLHHITSDAWSIALFINEIFLLYNAFKNKQLNVLQPLTHQYKDYACWQEKQISSNGQQFHKQYWLNIFSDTVPPLHLPMDKSRPAFRSYRGSREIRLFDKKLSDRLHHTAQKYGSSLYMVLLSLTNLLLFKYSGQTDIVIGSPIAGRDHPNLKDQIGIYLNTLPIRSVFSKTDTFEELLTTTKERVLDAFEHSVYPFDLLLEDLQINWDSSRSPLFDVALVLQNVSIQGVKQDVGMENIVISPFENTFETSAIDLRIEFTEYDDGLGMVVDYNTDIFLAKRIQNLISSYEILARNIDNILHEKLHKINYLPVEEKELLLSNFGAKSATQNAGKGIDDVFRHTVNKYSKKTAIIHKHQKITYNELDDQVDRLAAYLVQTCKVKPGEFVCVHLEKSVFSIISVLAVFRSGGVYVPIDTNHPTDRKKYIVEDTDTNVLLTTSNHMYDLDFFEGQLVALDLQLETLDTVIIPKVIKNNHSLAYVIYTSGTTGVPKGVLIKHESILKRVLYCNDYLEITGNDCILQFASVGFDASLYEIFMALIPGGRLVLVDDTTRQNLPEFLKLLQREQVTVATLTPAFLKILGKEQMPTLRSIITTGEAALLEEAIYYSSFKNYYNGYGPTEACIGATFYKVDPSQKTYYNQLNSIPIGGPFADTRIYILDEDMNLVGIGNPGEICIASSCLAVGYLNDSELTTAKFIENPFFGSDGYEYMYRTGDTGRWNYEGILEFIGRIDGQIQINGIRVELNEVTAHLLKHPKIEGGKVIYIEGRGLIGIAVKKKKIRFLPNLSVLNQFDSTLQSQLKKDDFELSAYTKVFSKYLPGKTVLSIGSENEALLARLAINNGADLVFVIEENQSTYENAEQIIKKDNLDKKIVLIKGNIEEIDIPSNVDYVIHNLSGKIGGERGASARIDQAKRFLKNNQNIIPCKYHSHVSAYKLDEEKFDWAFEEIPAGHVKKIFESTGYPFDLRLCLNEFDENDILSERGTLEEVDFQRYQKENRIHNIELNILRDSTFTGLLIGLNTTFDDVLTIDHLKEGENQFPVYIPCFHPGIPLKKDSVIQLSIKRELLANNPNPSFHIDGNIVCSGEDDVKFEYHGHNDPPLFRESYFYKKLFSENGEVVVIDSLSSETVKTYLRQKLPVYMIPQKVIFIDEIPLNINGKIDEKKILKELDKSQTITHIPPVTEIELKLAEIWKSCLAIDIIGLDDNFFELGANSLRVIRALKLLNDEFPGVFQITDIFSYPTITGLRCLFGQEIISSEDEEIEVLDF